MNRMSTYIYNKPARTLLTLLLACLFFLTSKGQATGDKQVRHFELSAQLPSNVANFVYQDEEGIMWLGTKGGVSRYDGYNVQTFRSNLAAPKMLPSNNVLAMAENQRCYMIGTAKGLAILDKRTFKVSSLPFADVNNVEIRSLAIDHRGNVWVGTYRTLLRLSPDLRHCDDMSKRGVRRTSVNQVYVDRQGNVWVMLWEYGLSKYNPATNRFSSMASIGSRNNPFRMLQNSDGSYVISTWGNGLYAMDGKGRISKIRNDKSYDELLSCVFGIVRDSRDGMLWMVENGNLITARLNGNRLAVVHMEELGDVAKRQFNSICKDRDGDIWLCTKDDGFIRVVANRGAYAFVPLGSAMPNVNARPYVTAIYDDGQGLWYALNGIGIGYDAYNGSKTCIAPMPDHSSMSSFQNVSFIARPSFLPKNHAWILSQFQNKILELEHANGELRLVRVISTDTPGLPRTLFEDSKHNLWLATNIGMTVKRRGDSKFRLVKELPYDDFISITEDDKGWLWMASQSHGVVRVKVADGNGGTLRLYQKHAFTSRNSQLATDHVEALAYDNRSQRVWIGLAEGGVYAYDTKRNKLENHSKIMEGCMRGDIVNIVPDTRGQIWIVSAMDIARYNPSRGSLNVYTSADMGVADFAKNAFALSRAKGCLHFAGRGGAVCLGLEWHGNVPNRNPHTLIVSDMKAGGESIRNGLNDDSYALDNHGRELRLGSDARNIEINFTACDYGQQRRVFAYKLDGVDKSWNYCGERRASAYYTDIPAGKHRLLIRSTDENGSWTSGVTAYTLYKEPHLWETWWAYVIYIVAAIAIAYLVFTKTRQRIRERQLRQIDRIERQKEKELVQTKLRYFTNISHDFLTPITVITCIIDEMRATTDDYHAQIVQIRSNLNRLRRLIQQVLDFRKMENGKMALAVSEASLTKLVGDICHDHFEPLATKENLRFNVSLPSDRDICGYFDAGKVEKMLTNILSNAFKYTERGSISVVLSEEENDGKHLAIIEVADTGVGIAPEDMKHIFDRFYTAKSSRSDSNGVGLSLVKDIATLHHASIDVRSEVGKGSTFTIALPLDAASYLPTEMADKSMAADLLELRGNAKPADVPTTADDRKMLIVEDNDELLEIMRRVFSHYHNVLTARNGEEAMGVVASDQPDIIVSDVMMPVMDGLEMCRRMKADAETSHIPIILLTARSTAADRIECYEAGADGYIAKPFELDVLKARIEGFLRQRHERQQAYRTADTADTGKLQMSVIDKMFMEKATREVETHLSDEDYDIGQLADAVCMSKSTLYRKIKSLTDMSPVEFLRSMRMKKSLRLINESPEISISEVADACGFSSVRYFSRCFKEEYGVTPSEMRKNPA